MASKNVTVEVDGQRLKLSNLDKVLYPETGFRKGEVIDYYVRIAPVLLPHITNRPLTLLRYPDGVDGQSFFEKDVSRHAPDWVRTANVPTPGSSRGSESLDFAIVDDLPTLVWVANLASLELHVPQWTIGPRSGRRTIGPRSGRRTIGPRSGRRTTGPRGGRRDPDLLVFDLDPGPPATIVECCKVAVRLRALLEADGLDVYPKTSGSKGMQLYSPVQVSNPERTSSYAKTLAEQLARELPDLVVARMTKAMRKGKVFIDWSQNNPNKTTIAPYSLRARPHPTVSTPLTWDEVEACETVEAMTFLTDDLLARVDEHGDLFEGLLTDDRPKLPA